jgi:Fur family ferric uptake transcriptional regulator
MLFARMHAGQVDPREMLARAGLKATRQRVHILDVLAAETDDVTAQEIHRRLVAAGEQVGLATVYRTLGALCAQGLVDTLAHNPGEACYRLCGEGHHHHLVCTDCHRVIELAGCGLDDWLAQVAAAEGFRPTEHRVEVLGVCAACRS